jgi:hypothetical protein
MKTILAVATLSAATMLPAAAVAQKAVAQGGEALVNASSAGVVRQMSSQYANFKPVPAKALLTDYLSSHWTKTGDPIKARLSGSVQLTDGTVLSRGTVLLGHVDQVENSTHGSNGTLTLTFDQAKTKAGTVIPIKATIVKVAEAFDPADPIFSVELDAHQGLPSSANVVVTPLSKGTVGLNSSQNAPLSGKIICNGENLTLEDGTQFLLAISAQPTSRVAAETK